MKFFEILNQQNIFDDYADVLDWILSDNKFPKEVWDNKNKVQAFTKGINRLNGLTKSTIHYDAQKNIMFPQKGTYKDYEIPTIYIAKKDSQARDLIRHIRNGVAHGNIELYFIENSLIAEILDYENNQKKAQTAYILIPLYYLKEIYNLYLKKEKRWKKQKYKSKNKKILF